MHSHVHKAGAEADGIYRYVYGAEVSTGQGIYGPKRTVSTAPVPLPLAFTHRAADRSAVPRIVHGCTHGSKLLREGLKCYASFGPGHTRNLITLISAVMLHTGMCSHRSRRGALVGVPVRRLPRS